MHALRELHRGVGAVAASPAAALSQRLCLLPLGRRPGGRNRGGPGRPPLASLVAPGAAAVLRRHAAPPGDGRLAGNHTPFFHPRRPISGLAVRLRARPDGEALPDLRAAHGLLPLFRQPRRPPGALSLPLLYSGRAALADDVCTALQLANFWQDVGRDLDIGRVYLPAEDRERFGYPDSDLHARRYTPAFVELMRFQVDRTRERFMRGLPLVGQLGANVRLDIELFIRGGLAILRQIERCRYDVWRKRPALGRWHKAALLGGAVVRRLSALVS